MNNKEKSNEELQQKINNLEARVQYLQQILDNARIPYDNNGVLSTTEEE